MGVRKIGLATLLAVASLFAVNVGSANAASYGTCNGLGTLKAQNGVPKAQWQLSAKGSCISSPVGKQVEITGTGTSDSLGLCTPGALLVTGLRLDVNITWTNEPTGAVENEQQTWYMPASLFPIATPFLVQRKSYSDFPARLAGLALHHLTLSCGNNGQAPAASFTWVST